MREPSLKTEQTTVMILAAGYGKRMLPLTEKTPKPLLSVGDKSLIEHHLTRLKAAGFKSIVINVAHLGQQIIKHLGNGERYGLEIQYSDETETGPLETAGGIKQALPLISSDPFIVINGDIYSDFPFERLLARAPANHGVVVLVPNPEHNPDGDFAIDAATHCLAHTSQDRLTFSGIAMYRKAFFAELDDGVTALAPLLRMGAENATLEAISYSGIWHDIGTPQRLHEIDEALKSAGTA